MYAKTSKGDDPFAKVKGLINDMIARLDEKASADATHKGEEIAAWTFEVEKVRSTGRPGVGFPGDWQLHHGGVRLGGVAEVQGRRVGEHTLTRALKCSMKLCQAPTLVPRPSLARRCGAKSARRTSQVSKGFSVWPELVRWRSEERVLSSPRSFQ